MGTMDVTEGRLDNGMIAKIQQRGSNCRNRKCGICVSVVMLGTFIGCVLFAYTALASTANERTLEQVVFVFRHGDRTPTETYPNDPYLHYNWEGGWGSLTKKGMQQLHTVGRWIRKEYRHIIGERYFSNVSLTRSSYADRCIMSAQALLAGLYPPTPEEMFVPNLPWRPIPVHATPKALDKVIVVGAPCPRLAESLKEAYANESQRSDEKMASYYKELTEHAGKPMKTITDVEFLYNTLEIEDQHGLILPEWTKKFYNAEMREIAARSLALFTSGDTLKRLRGGPLLKEIFEHMMDTTKDNSKNTKKVYLYSVHDITLVDLLRTMGFTNELMKPDYGATLIIELHSISGKKDKEVKMLYLNNTETLVAHPMRVPKCEDHCLLQTLGEIWNDVMPENWDKECLQ